MGQGQLWFFGLQKMVYLCEPLDIFKGIGEPNSTKDLFCRFYVVRVPYAPMPLVIFCPPRLLLMFISYL